MRAFEALATVAALLALTVRLAGPPRRAREADETQDHNPRASGESERRPS